MSSRVVDLERPSAGVRGAAQLATLPSMRVPVGFGEAAGKPRRPGPGCAAPIACEALLGRGCFCRGRAGVERKPCPDVCAGGCAAGAAQVRSDGVGVRPGGVPFAALAAPGALAPQPAVVGLGAGWVFDETGRPVAVDSPARRRRLRSQRARAVFAALGRALLSAVCVLGVGLTVQAVVVESVTVSGSSMMPTVADGDVVVVNKLAYVFSSPARGDVVVFHLEGLAEGPKTMIKRVVGTEGETVALEGCQLFVESRWGVRTEVPEPYLDAAAVSPGGCGPGFEVTVPDGYLMVLGDNRVVSRDSRMFGLVHTSTVLGKAAVRFEPAPSLL